jgi:hypothetical protein
VSNPRLTFSALWLTLVAAVAVVLAGCTKSVPSVAEAKKRAEIGFVGNIRLSGYCRADRQVDWLYDKSGADQWQSAPIALDVSSLVRDVPPEHRREARIRMMLKFEAKRVEVRGVLQKGFLGATQKVTDFVAVEQITELEQPPGNFLPAALPKICPYGHGTLRHVKIIYSGLGPPLDAKTREAAAKYEVSLVGTDVFSPSSPQWTVYCSTCGFLLERGFREWIRKAEDAGGFVEPLSLLIREFPVPDPSLRTLTEYRQELVAGLGNRESLVFVTTESRIILLARIVNWADLYGYSLTPRNLPEPHPYDPKIRS